MDKTIKRFLISLPLLLTVWAVPTEAKTSVTAYPFDPNVFFAQSSENVRGFVREYAILQGIDPERALFILHKESQDCFRGGAFNPTVRGDDGNGVSRGCWQISRRWHPEISDECAYDLICSTIFSIDRIKKGYINEWSTWKHRKAWYGSNL